MKRARLVALLVACALPACNTITSENQGELSGYLDNAAGYYDGGHFLSAYEQWDRALKIDPHSEEARLGQAMALYQMGRIEAPEAVSKYLTEATKRVDALRAEDFDRDQWKVELAAALVHQRWCDLYDRKIRLSAAREKLGVPPNKDEIAIARREFAAHLDVAEKAFQNVLAGEEKEPRDRLTCWLALAQIAHWREDLPGVLTYADKYLELVKRSEELWRRQVKDRPNDKPIYDSKLKGAEMQEAELRDLRGVTLYRLGRVEEAEKELSRLVELFPKRATPYFNRGVIRQSRGDDDLARGDLKRFIELTDLPADDPTVIDATVRLRDVQRRLDAQAAKAGLAPPSDKR
jgi:tetratricopeptide (TPR) repeat protein